MVTMKDFDRLTEQEISQRLLNKTPATHDVPQSLMGGYKRQAGVLVPFVRVKESWHLLYVRRSEFEDDMHSGQVAFAGGKYEEFDESLEATALRETQEEIGVDPEHVRILGELSQHHTISKFQVIPFVATMPWPYHLTLEEKEIAHAFTIPLDWLSNPDNHEVRYRTLEHFDEPVPVVYFDKYDGELLWGATARMTLSLIDALRG